MEIGFFNETNVNLDKELKIVKNVLEHGLHKLEINEAIFNIIIVDNNYIHKLNKEYRGIDRETDVITFALEDDKTFNPSVRILGDVYISVDKAKSQSEEYNHSFLRELCFLAVHGMLHLLGYDHMKKDEEEVMFKLQEETYSIKRFYESFAHAISGFISAFKTEQNLLFDVIFGILTIIIGFLLKLSIIEIVIVLLAIALVISMELVNTAIEYVVDMAMPEIHPLAKLSKDIASASVLISALMAFIIGLIIYLPKFIALF